MIIRLLICWLFLLSPHAVAGTTYRMTDFPLFDAVYKGDIAKINEVIKNGEDINRVVGEDTPLTYAISLGKIEVVKVLLAHGADVNKQTPILTILRYGGMQPNTEADELRRLAVLNLLLEAGANPNPEKVVDSPLTVALETGQMRLFIALKQVGATFGHDAPMIEAVKNNRPEMIQNLLKIGIGVDEEKRQGCTALCQAVFEKNSKIVALLLKSGARWTAHGMAYEEHRSITWAEMIVQSSTEILEQFLNAGLAANSRLKNDTNMTLLHQAAIYAEPSAIALLLARGAKINAQDDAGNTPLMLAASTGKLENVDALITAKADVTLIDTEGRTAKLLAAETNRADIVARLVKAGAAEYVGKSMPQGTVYDKELEGKEQTDVSGDLHQALPFLPKSLRFFVAHEKELQPIPSSKLPPPRRIMRSGTLYAVLTDSNVIRLDNPNSFVFLHMNIISTNEAQRLTKFFSDPSLNWKVRFLGVDFTEFPEAGECLAIEPEPSKFGITKPIVIEYRKGIFTIVRFGIQDWDGNKNIAPQVVKVTEKVKNTGEYTRELTDLPTPNLSIRFTCGLR